jgi:hypothetical protein
LKEITMQNASLKAAMDAAASEAAVVTKGLEDALARAKAEIERLQVLVTLCICPRAMTLRVIGFVKHEHTCDWHSRLRASVLVFVRTAARTLK